MTGPSRFLVSSHVMCGSGQLSLCYPGKEVDQLVNELLYPVS